MEERQKAKQLKEKFGTLANMVIDELLDNNEQCSSRYKTDYDRVCIREYWINVKAELNLDGDIKSTPGTAG